MKSLSTLALRLALPVAVLAPIAGHTQLANDPNYRGSSYNEVLSVLEDQGFLPPANEPKHLAEFARYRSGILPQYPVNFESIEEWALIKDSKRTLNTRADYFDRIDKLVHANGVCVVGDWKINAASPYSGYFKQNTNAKFIGRISVALQSTTNADDRGFGFAGKIFPTINPDAKVPTTSFFTVDVLSGTPAQRFLDVNLTNSPPLTPGASIFARFIKIAIAFLQADSQPTFRPVTQIARMGETGAIKSPVYMRLRPQSGVIKNNEPDFRNEVVHAMQANGGKLVFNIDVSDKTGAQSDDRMAPLVTSGFDGWHTIGTITVDRSIVSYGCDRRLHFAHPLDDKSNAAAEAAAAAAKKK